MDVVDIAGRVLFALVFWQNGYRQLANRAGSVAYAKSFGAPNPEVSVPVTGVVMLAGGALLVLGIWPDLAVLALAAFVVAAALVAHRYWEETDFGMRAGQEAQFMKNIALAGACLFMFAIFNRFGDDLPGLTGPLF
jgi:putative oxidoreductase